MGAIAGRLSAYTIEVTLRPPGIADTPLPPEMATPVGPAGAPSLTGDVLAAGTSAADEEHLATVRGAQTPRYTDGSGAPLTELYFRLYPNLRQDAAGGMADRDDAVDGVPVAPEPPPLHAVSGATAAAAPDPGAGGLVLLRVPLGKVLPPGGTAAVRTAFTTTVPSAPADGAGPFRLDPDTGAWALAHWFPVLAGHDAASGWETDPPAAWSDPTFSNTALFDVTLTAPDDLALVTTGVSVEERGQGDLRVWRVASGPARDVAVVAAPGLVSSSTEVGETTVTAHHAP